MPRKYAYFLHIYTWMTSYNLPAPALIIFFDVFRECANQIEYSQREENAPAFLVSVRNKGYTYTREPLRVPPHIHVRRKLASWSKEGSSTREKERRRNEVEIAHHSTSAFPPLPSGGHFVYFLVFHLSSLAARTRNFNHNKVGMANLRTVTNTI